MTKTYKLALLAAIGLASVTAAHAQNGDLIVGVYQPGDNNTTTVNLGLASGLYNGETWSLSSALSAAGITLTTSGQYGVIGYTAPGGGAADTSYATSQNFNDTFGDPGSNSAFQADGQTDIATIYNHLGTVSTSASGQAAGTDWYNETVLASAGYQADSGINPNSAVGTAVALTSEVIGSGAENTLLNFNLSTGGILPYGTVAAPEPAAYGVFAGLGLLAFSLRNKLVRKQA